jgi:hypothetical protein
MATYVLRPNANWNNNAAFTNTGGAASHHAALADNSDSTYIIRTSSTVQAAYEMELGTTTLAATERVVSVNLRAKLNVGTNGIAQLSLGVITDRNGRTVYYSVPFTKQKTFATATVDASLYLTTAPDGSAWTQTLIDNLVVKFLDGATASGDRSQLMEVYVDVLTTAQPTTTVTAPSGTISDTSFPAVTWTYADSDGDIQSAYEIKIFSAAQYGASGFNPETSSSVETTGIIISPNNGQTLEVDLPNSTTYRAYVKTAQLVNGLNYFSEWAYSQFTMGIDSPAIPTIAAYYDSNDGSVAVTVFGRTNVLSTNQASFETNTDGWVAVDNCTIARTTAQASDGTASLSLTSVGAGTMTASTTSATKFAVTANQSFSAMAEFRTAFSARSCSVGIIWLTSAGAAISTLYGTASVDSSSSWGQKTVSGTAPATAAYAQVIVRVADTSTIGEVHYIDKIAFHAGTSPFWTRGGFSNFVFDVERTDDNGATYSAIRNSPVDASTAQIAQLSDYEVPLSTVVYYRAKARATI